MGQAATGILTFFVLFTVSFRRQSNILFVVLTQGFARDHYSDKPGLLLELIYLEPMEWCPSGFFSSGVIHFARKYLTSSATDNGIICGHLYSKFQVLPRLSKFLPYIQQNL